MRLQRKNVREPDEVRRFPHGQVAVLGLDDVVVGRFELQPGWRWSIDVAPIAGTSLCQYHHLGYILSGRMRTMMADGSTMDFGPGDAHEIPPGHDAWVLGDEPVVSIDVAGVRQFARESGAAGDRVLATILFTDIVDSTATAARLGDTGWRALFAEHNDVAQVIVDRYRGRLVKTTGDGMLAIFDGAERAARAALGFHGRLGSMDLSIRAGIHTGEVELVSGDVRGIAVHAAARIMALAGPREVLMSGVTADLLDGSGLTFEERGSHELKGLSGARRIVALTG